MYGRPSGTDRAEGTLELKDTILAYEAALAAYEALMEDDPQRSVPMDYWSKTKSDMGTALWSLGKREKSVARIKAAIAAFEEALSAREKAEMRMYWVLTQENLAWAYKTLAEFSETPDTRDDCIRRIFAHVDRALAVFKEDENPFNHQKAAKFRDERVAFRDASGQVDRF